MTSSALDSIARLRRLAAMLQDGDDDARWLAERLARYFTDAERGATLELCLDLSPKPGDAPWFETDRLDRRDELLLQITANHFPGLSPARAAPPPIVADFPVPLQYLPLLTPGDQGNALRRLSNG